MSFTVLLKAGWTEKRIIAALLLWLSVKCQNSVWLYNKQTKSESNNHHVINLVDDTVPLHHILAM